MNQREARKLALFHAGIILETAIEAGEDIARESIIQARVDP